MPLYKRFSILAAMLVAGLVGGCFMSEGPLLTKDNADYPFKKMTAHQTSDPKSPLIWVRVGDVYEVIEPDDRKSSFISTFLFKKIGEDVFVGQLTTAFPLGGGASAPIITYSIIKQRGNDLDTLYCGNYSDAQLSKLGITTIKGSPVGQAAEGKVCRVKSLDQLIALSKEKPAGERKIRRVKIDSVEK